MTETQIIYKERNSPFHIELFDVDGSLYSSAEMEAITRVYLKYIPSLGADPEYIDSDVEIQEVCFDWVTYASSGKLSIDLGLADLTTGRDVTAELIVYDAKFTAGRIFYQLDILVSEEAIGE